MSKCVLSALCLRLRAGFGREELGLQETQTESQGSVRALCHAVLNHIGKHFYRLGVSSSQLASKVPLILFR